MLLLMHIAAYYHETFSIVRAGTWIEDVSAETFRAQLREKGC